MSPYHYGKDFGGLVALCFFGIAKMLNLVQIGNLCNLHEIIVPKCVKMQEKNLFTHMIKAIYSHLDMAILPLKNGSIENDPIFLLKLLLEFDLLLTLSKLLTVHDVDFFSEISGSVFTKNEILHYFLNFLQSHSEVSILLIKALVIIGMRPGLDKILQTLSQP